MAILRKRKPTISNFKLTVMSHCQCLCSVLRCMLNRCEYRNIFTHWRLCCNTNTYVTAMFFAISKTFYQWCEKKIIRIYYWSDIISGPIWFIVDIRYVFQKQLPKIVRNCSNQELNYAFCITVVYWFWHATENIHIVLQNHLLCGLTSCPCVEQLEGR